MKSMQLSKKIISVLLVVFMMAGVLFGVDFLPEIKADAATIYQDVTDLFHDQGAYFMSNIQPTVGESVTIRLRVVKGNISSANLIYYNVDTSKSTTVAMSKSSVVYDNSGYYEYWEGTFTVPDTSKLYYYFSVTQSRSSGSKTSYYIQSSGTNLLGTVTTTAPAYSNGWLICPPVQTPEWAKGMVWYSLVPDEFFNGDPSNDDYDSDGNYDNPWNTPLGSNLSKKYGGDFEGIMNKIAYIKSLGVNGVCYNPVNTANQSVGYGSSNFNQIESALGNAQTYKQFIRFMHDNDFRLLQDVAVYHASNDSILINNSNRWPTPGVAAGPESPYYGVTVDHELSGNKITTPNWGGSIINHANPITQSLLWSTDEGALVRYTNDALGFGVDGYRFDCGGWMIGHDSNGNVISSTEIMKQIRSAIKNTNPEALVLSESSGEGQLNAGAFDAEWNLRFLQKITPYINEPGSVTTQNLRNFFVGQIHIYARQTYLCNHLQLNTHDNQGKCFTDENYKYYGAAKLVQMTQIGAPSIYFGEELNFKRSFSYFDWDESKWDYEVLNFNKALVELKNEYTATKDGALIEFSCDTNSWVYGRFDENGAAITAVNTGNSATTTTISVYKLGLAAGSTITDWFTGKTYTADSNGNVTLDVPVVGTIFVSGNNRSSFTAGHIATSITNDVSESLVVSVAGNKQNVNGGGSVSVAANQTATITNVTLGDKFAISGDYTFTPVTGQTSEQASQIGLSIGETVIDGVTYKVGVVVRPFITAGSQAILCLTAGVEDQRSKWIGVFSGPNYTLDTSNTVNFKLEYDNGILKAYFNGEYKSQIDVSAYDIEFKPEFFNRGYSNPVPFTLTNIKLTGKVGSSNRAVSSADGTVTISRTNDVITLAEDNFMFYNTTAFGAYTYSAYVDSNTTGSPLVMIRNSVDGDAPYYAAVNNNGIITVYARYKKGTVPVAVTSVSAQSAAYIKLERDENNTFRAYVGSGTDASVNYVLISGSETSISMDDRTYVGYSNLNNSASVRPLGVVNTSDKILSDDFSGSVFNPLLSGVQNSSATVSGGKATLSDGDVLTANTPDNDWTFKTKLNYTPTTEGDYAGIINYQDADTFIVTGRMMKDGKVKLFFARYANGNFATIHITDDPRPNSDVTLQLQRIATAYTAVYTYDEVKWTALGGSLYYNMSDENPGITVSGSANAQFDFVTFGNAVNDGATYNTPHSPNVDNFSITSDRFTGTYNLESLSGTWTDAPEGFYQTDNTLAQLIIRNKKYNEFRAEATLKLEEGADWVGINFGRKEPDSAVGNGYLLKYTSEGTLVLEKNGVAIETYTLTDEVYDGVVRVVIEAFNGNLYISAGQQSKLVMEILNNDYTTGFVSFCSNGPARVNNLNVISFTSDMLKDGSVNYSDAGVQLNGSGIVYSIYITESGISTGYTENQYIAKFATDSTDEAKEIARAEFRRLLAASNLSRAETRTLSSLRGVASTNFIISTRLSFIRKTSNATVNTDSEGNEIVEQVPNYVPEYIQQAGLILGGSAGLGDLVSDGIYLKFTSEGKLYFERNGENLCEPYTVPDADLDIYLMVVKYNGTYYVYVDGGKTPVFTYTETASNGGAFVFISNNGTARFDGISLKDLDLDEGYVNTQIYNDWMLGANLANKGGYYFNDFTDSSINDDEWLVHHGNKWEISNGTLHTNDNIVQTPWDTSVCYSEGVYSDFILNFKMLRTDLSVGWASVGFRRISPSVGHQVNGDYLLFNNSGSITRMGYDLCEEDAAFENSGKVDGKVTLSVWQNFTLVVQGTSIKLYNDGKLVYTGTSSRNIEGYIEFKSGNTPVYFDDIEIIPLSTTVAPLVDTETDVADDLFVSVGGVDYTQSFVNTGSILASAGDQVKFSNFSAPEGKYSLSATLSKTSAVAGYFDVDLGIVNYQDDLYNLAVRITPDISSSNLYSNAALCLVNDEATVTLETWFVNAGVTSHSIDVEYNNNKVTVWIDENTAFANTVDLSDYGASMLLPEISFNSSGFGMRIDDLAVFGGAQSTVPETVTVNDGFTFSNGNKDFTYDYMLNGKLGLNSENAYISNLSTVQLTGLSAKFELDSSKYTNYNYHLGFVLGTAKYNGVTDTLYAVVSQKTKTAAIYFGDTKLYSASIVKDPTFGDHIFWEDDETVSLLPVFSNANEIEMSFEMNARLDITFNVDYVGAGDCYTVNLFSLGITRFTPAPGFTTKYVSATVSDISVSGVGLNVDGHAQNVTSGIVLGNHNSDYAANGNFTVSSDMTNILGNIIYGNGKFYFAGATFSSVPNGATVGIQLGDGVAAVLTKTASDVTASITKAGTAITSVSVTSANAYKLVVGYENGKVCVWVNDNRVITDFVVDITEFEFAVIATSANATVVSNIAAWGTLDVSAKTADTENGKVNVLAVDKVNGLTVISVTPNSGYQLVSGSLKYTDSMGITRTVIARYNDSNPNEFVIYTADAVTLTAEFTDMSVTSVTTATLGSSLHYFDDTVSGTRRIDGVRFLTRLYMPIENINPQTGVITVKYNGVAYTVENYGALIIPTTIMDRQGIAYSDLSFENKDALTALEVSARNGYLFYNSAEYIDFTVVIRIPDTTKTGADRDAYYGKYYAREYVLRSYAVLRPVGSTDSSNDIVIYGNSFIDSINNVISRMESEG